MKLPITCLCGAALRVEVRRVGKPLICPTCGNRNLLDVPVAGIPEPAVREGEAPAEPPISARQEPLLPVAEPRQRVAAEPMELPTWIVAPILACLTLVGGVVVLVGWWIAQPADESAACAHVQVQETTPEVVQTPGKTEPPMATIEEPVVATRPSQFVLPRRMPSGGAEPPALRITAAMPTADPVAEKPPPGAGTMEKPVSGLIPRIEVSAGASADSLYSVRRLRLPDDAVKPLRLAVTPAGHDDIGSVLTRMGDGYRFSNLRNQDLLSLPAMQAYDVIFLTCADIFAQDFQAVLPLRKFVEQGGTLYASDLRGDLVLAAFPEYRAGGPLWPGVPQRVDASVVEPGLQAFLQRKVIPLTFESPGWRPAAFDAKKVTICLTGLYRDTKGQTASAPLLVKFRAGQGTVIFTSFHHAKNDSAVVSKLLDYLVFASVSARSETRVRELMQRHDFAPQDLHPVVLNAGAKTTAVYQHPGGGLQIAIGFENQGAKLKLTLRAPTGQTIEHDDQGIFLIEVPKASAGPWQYTITPLELPHENFPGVVAVGRQPG